MGPALKPPTETGDDDKPRKRRLNYQRDPNKREGGLRRNAGNGGDEESDRALDCCCILLVAE